MVQSVHGKRTICSTMFMFDLCCAYMFVYVSVCYCWRVLFLSSFDCQRYLPVCQPQFARRSQLNRRCCVSRALQFGVRSVSDIAFEFCNIYIYIYIYIYTFPSLGPRILCSYPIVSVRDAMFEIILLSR